MPKGFKGRRGRLLPNVFLNLADGQSTVLGGRQAAKGEGGPGCCPPKGSFKARLLPMLLFEAGRNSLKVPGRSGQKAREDQDAAYQKAAKGAGARLKPGVGGPMLPTKSCKETAKN